ncbi:unnamed protein product [Pocillopora meandrina]|uniref:FBA domain-containing protein n=1 Tax=Pocillopora meandrina TaxID=46732 RepID=A0AAU9WPN1_9CNID|nr:unnamed protein product [Pocillopora meandrina]
MFHWNRTSKSTPTSISSQENEKKKVLGISRFAVETGGSGAFEIKASLLDGSQTELPEDQSFTVRREVTDAQGSWELLSHTFTEYPSGLRCIHFEERLKSNSMVPKNFDLKVFQPSVKFPER